MNKILILTTTYPYGQGDHFVESEIESLLENNLEISILPQHALTDELVHPSLVNKVSLHKGLIGQNYHFSPSKLTSYLFTREGALSLFKVFSLTAFESFKSLLSETYVLIFGGDEVVTERDEKLQQKSRDNLPELPKNTFKSRIKPFFRKFKNKTKDSYATFAKIFVILSEVKSRNIKFQDYDLIYSYWGHDLALSTGISTGEKPPLVCRFHGYDLYRERRKSKFFPLRSFLLKNLNLALFVSDQGVNYINEQYSPKSLELKVNYLGSDDLLSNFKYNDNTEELRIVSCSSLTPVKQVDVLINALGQLDIKFSWLHIGDGGLKDKLLNLSESVLKNKNCTFLFKGYVNKFDIGPTIADFSPSVFVNSSKSEGLPVSIMESMSMGIPIIAPNVGGVSEAVHNGVNGFLLDPGFSVSNLTQALQKFNHLSAQDRSEMSKNSKAIWDKNFNGKKCKKELVDRLQSLISLNQES